MSVVCHSERDLSALLEPTTLEPAVGRVLGYARGAARETRTEAWLVGGFIRDALLGVPSRDLDFVVEGDAGSFARALAVRSGAELAAHPRFSTYTLEGLDGIGVDVATARSETYVAVAALPEVAPAPIDRDLARRDFSVNAMALPLGGGPLLDPYSGRTDLESGTLRALHERSFFDDPTRASRGIAFELRLGIRLDGESLAWLESARKAGAFEALSASRSSREVRAILDRPELALGGLDRWAELGLLPHLLPGLEWGSRQRTVVASVIERWRSRKALPPADSPTERPTLSAVLLAALASELEPHAMHPLAERMDVKTDEKAGWETSSARIRRARVALEDSTASVSERLDGLERLSPAERIILETRLGEAGLARLEATFRIAEDTMLRIDGGDLLAAGIAGGPALGQALAAVRKARLDGLCDAEGELALALETARGLLEEAAGEKESG